MYLPAQRMSRLVEPLTLTFHMNYKWWAAVELTRRVVILVFIVAFPRNNVSLDY